MISFIAEKPNEKKSDVSRTDFNAKTVSSNHNVQEKTLTKVFGYPDYLVFAL